LKGGKLDSGGRCNTASQEQGLQVKLRRPGPRAGCDWGVNELATKGKCKDGSTGGLSLAGREPGVAVDLDA